MGNLIELVEDKYKGCRVMQKIQLRVLVDSGDIWYGYVNIDGGIMYFDVSMEKI